MDADNKLIGFFSHLIRIFVDGVFSIQYKNVSADFCFRCKEIEKNLYSIGR